MTNIIDGKSVILPTIPESHYTTYQVHKQDVHIDIWRIPPAPDWDVQSSILRDSTEEFANPVGYGTVNNSPKQNTVVEIDFGGFGIQQYLPYGIKQGVAIAQDFRDQFRADINNLSALFPPANKDLDANFTYPILNIGYVIVNEPFEKINR